MQFGGTTYGVTDADTDQLYLGLLYESGFLEEVGEYEQTSEPSVNDTDFTFSTSDNLFRILGLQGGFVNRPCTLYRQTLDVNGEVTETEQVFGGFLTEFGDSPKDQRISFTAASVWADFEKTTGLRTNVKSQSRFNPLDQGLRHAVNAIKALQWGRASDEPLPGAGGGGTFPDPNNPGEEQN
jgi:hypothetical protein